MDELFSYIDEHVQQYIENLQALCRQPSVAAQNLGMGETGRMVIDMLEEVGAETQLIPTAGQPVILGQVAGQGDKVLSFYNHYDVQPPEPLDLWEVDPYSAEIKEGLLYARGSSDNKGDLVARISAVDAFLKVHGSLPLTVKFIVEGEEEVGSPNLESFAEEHSGLLKADGCIWEGGFKDPKDRLEIYLGVKGISYVEVSVTAANSDLHSMWGTIVPNAVWRLIWALNSLKGEDEHIRIASFYDRVRELGPTEVEALERLDFDEEGWRQKFGLDRYLLDLSGLELLKKHLFQPTCTICGINGGYTGQGLKTVLPNTASAKVDFRLVPDQEPEEVVELLQAHLEKEGFADVEVKLLAGEHPARTALDDPLAEVVVDTARKLYPGQPVVYPLVAGTGPMYVLCQQFGIPAVSTGIAYAGSNTHAPNENIRVADYINGIKHIALIMDEFARD